MKPIHALLMVNVITFGTAIVPGFAAAAELRVVASFSIIADLARNVGGDRIALTTLVGPGGDAHVYQPKPADAAAAANADIVLVNGLGLEGFLGRLVAASGTAATVVELADGAALLPGHDHHAGHEEAGAEEDHHPGDGHDHAAGAFDPHAWQSVPNAIVYVGAIADAFCAADASGCDTYRANAATYTTGLRVLDAEVRAAVSEIPEERRTIITSHDAFGYFGHEYGLRFLAPQGVSTESEASAADVAALIRQIRDDRASAIFVESITNPALVEQIASETGLAVGGSLYSDSLSPADGPASTYVDMVRHNIRTIRGAILGS